MTTPFPTFVPTWHTTSYDGIDPHQNPNIRATGKTIVITGSGRGIGARIASSFAAAGAANIVLIARTIPQLEKQYTAMTKAYPNTKTVIFSADIADSGAIEDTFTQIAATVGPVDILVSNAGYLPEPSSILSADIKDWWRGFETNILGAVNSVRGFLRHASTTPILISLSTCITHIPAIPGLSSYAASKEGFLRALDFLGIENPHLRIMNVHPGVLETEMHAKSGNVDMQTDDISLPANFVVWLASPEAEFLKGRYVWANWDIHELKAKKDIILKENLLVMGLRGWPAV